MRSPDLAEFGGEGQYVEITPPTRLVFTWQWDTADLGAATQLVEVTFTENQDLTTTVVLINRGLTEADVQSHLEDWHAAGDLVGQDEVEEVAVGHLLHLAQILRAREHGGPGPGGRQDRQCGGRTLTGLTQ